jgi:hypothetical protein
MILGYVNAAGKISWPILVKDNATKAEKKIAISEWESLLSSSKISTPLIKKSGYDGHNRKSLLIPQI